MKSLESISLTRLSVLEFGQHIKAIVTNLEQLGGGPGFITDPTLLEYMATLTSRTALYDKAQVKVTKSDETAKIAAADKARDTAVSAAMRYLSVFELSEVEAERWAFASLDTLFSEYKGLQSWNFEEESMGIDKLVTDLQGPKYSVHVATLAMGGYVERMLQRNADFKALFNKRTQETSAKEVYDTKAIRAELKTIYEDMVAYVLSMAKSKKTEEFNQSLNVINAVRKYYADLLAKRKTTKDDSEPPIPTM